jgi:hypothetical protein
MEDHWEKVREAGRASLQEEAARRWVDEPGDELETNVLWGKEQARLAFVAGGEFAIEKFAEAMALRARMAGLEAGGSYSFTPSGLPIVGK